MKIYISGKISGLDYNEVEEKFDDAEALLDEIGFVPVNPLKSGLPKEATWRQHMVRDIAMLLDCDAIYMMDDWIYSKGAQIEYDIANRLGMIVYFATNMKIHNKQVMRIQNAIHEATGMAFEQYTTKSRKREVFYARMIFAHHCKALKMSLSKIASIINRDRSTMRYLFSKYQDEMRFNPDFRKMAQKVDELLDKPI